MSAVNLEPAAESVPVKLEHAGMLVSVKPASAVLDACRKAWYEESQAQLAAEERPKCGWCGSCAYQEFLDINRGGRNYKPELVPKRVKKSEPVKPEEAVKSEAEVEPFQELSKTEPVKSEGVPVCAAEPVKLEYKCLCIGIGDACISGMPGNIDACRKAWYPESQENYKENNKPELVPKRVKKPVQTEPVKPEPVAKSEEGCYQAFQALKTEGAKNAKKARDA
jgi:hypothetical protein